MKRTPQPRRVPNVARLRARLQLTQKQLADQIGVSQPLIAMWEAGRRVPRGPAAILLAQISRDPLDKRK